MTPQLASHLKNELAWALVNMAEPPYIPDMKARARVRAEYGRVHRLLTELDNVLRDWEPSPAVNKMADGGAP